MIQLKTTNKEKKNIKTSFVFEADEPVTLSLVETEKGHTVAYVYKGTGDEIDEYTEPVACFDTEQNANDFVID